MVITSEMIILIVMLICANIDLVRGVPFTHHISLDQENKYQMWWRFDDKEITIKIEVLTTGWIAWGLSANGNMKGSDTVLGWVSDKGATYFNDRHILGYYEPPVDKEENYKLLEMSEQNGTTRMVFSRKLMLRNKEDFDITGDTMRVIYAWSYHDPLLNKFIHMHSVRGAKSVYLLDYGNVPRGSNLPTGYKTYDLLMSSYKVLRRKTAYRCKSFMLPKMSHGKHHLIRIDPIISKGNEGVVHHILLYHCFSMADETFNEGHDCLSPNMPDYISDCRNNPIHAWAVGGGNFYMPKEAGVSLNTESDPKYMLLEIHYDNPNLSDNIIDSSGLRIYYSQTLRMYDVAIIAAGVTPRYVHKHTITQIIPQGQQRFSSYGYCSSKCLNISENKLPKVFAVGLHSHLAGRKITVRLVRDSDGVEIKRIAQDLNYDFNFQEFKYLPEVIEIHPGHSVNVECEYNTKDRRVPVLSGVATQDEMCFAFLFYYPKINAKFCTSFTTAYWIWPEKVLGWKKGVKVNVIKGHQFTSKHPISVLTSPDLWVDDKDLVDKFEKAGKNYPHYNWCTYEDYDAKPKYLKVEAHKPVKSLNNVR